MVILSSSEEIEDGITHPLYHSLVQDAPPYPTPVVTDESLGPKAKLLILDMIATTSNDRYYRAKLDMRHSDDYLVGQANLQVVGEQIVCYEETECADRMVRNDVRKVLSTSSRQQLVTDCALCVVSTKSTMMCSIKVSYGISMYMSL